MARQQQKQRRKPEKEPRINREITAEGDVRVIYKGRNGDEPFNMVTSLKEAARTAARMELDLIEVNTSGTVPILLIDNYSKYRFEQKKSEKERKRNSSAGQLKEIQITTNISEHDMGVKARAAERFIKDGDKVKVVLKMRGRELGRREQSKKSILQFITMLEDVAVPESMPRDEGNKCIVILKKKK